MSLRIAPRIGSIAALLLASLAAAAAEQGAQPQAQAIADYPTGDSCLLCHRDEIGSTWLDDAHAWTVRPLGEAPEVISICGSCHLRGGRSKASERPYPHAYVAGEDLFKDFQVDLQLDSKAQLDSSDSHVYVKTRAVLDGGSEKSCADCHRVHGPPEPQQRDRKRFSEVCHY